MMKRKGSFKECYFCTKPSVLVVIDPGDDAWEHPSGLCNRHLFKDWALAGMSEDGYNFLTLEEFKAIIDVHKS